jgi:ribosomal protein L36
MCCSSPSMKKICKKGKIMKPDRAIDLICQHTMSGEIVPLRIRLRDDDGELREYVIKGYRDVSNEGLISFECRIIIRDTMQLVTIFSSNCRTWRAR